MTLVTRTHLDEMRYCARGSRRWFARHGLNWGEFVKNGLPAEVFEATGDAMALRLVAHAKERQHEQQ